MVENIAKKEPIVERDLGYYFHIITKRKWFIFIFFIASVAIAYFYTKRQVPIYRATSKIIIEASPPKILSSVKEVIQIGSLNYWTLKDYLQTQYKIIKSREVAKKVFEKLDEMGLAKKIKERVKNLPAGFDVYSYLQEKIDVVPVENSLVVKINATDSDKFLAKALANAFAISYMEYNAEFNKRITLNAYAELNQLAEKLRKQKEEAEKNLYEFQKKYNLGTFENKKNIIKKKLIFLNDTLTDLSVKLALKRAKYLQFKKYRDIGNVFKIGYSEISQDSIINDMKKKYFELKIKLLELSANFGEKHPKIVALKNEISYIEKSIVSEINSRIISLQNEIAEIKRAIATIKKETEKIKQEEIELNRIWMEYEPLLEKKKETTKFYENIKNRQTETHLSAQVETNNIRIFEYATTPLAPYKPNLKINVLIGILLGIFGGIGFAFLVEYLDNTIKSREEIEEEFGLTFLGMIPSIKPSELKKLGDNVPKELYLYHKPKSTIAELIRNIRTNLLFMSPEKPLKKIIISSPNPLEGKTTISVGIAISYAISGKKTILIDTDLRRARIHKIFNIKNENGVTEFLIRGGDIHNYMYKTFIDNLYLIPAGSYPPNPSELLHSKRFPEMIKLLEEEFDMIIFDSPPLIAVSDAYIIGKYTDGIIVVARVNQTTKPALRFVIKELLNLKINIIGCVLNDLDVGGRRYYYYKGKYYYYGKYKYEKSEDEDKD